MNISKSNFVLGCQCEKALWFYKYRPELKEISEETQETFNVGKSVGEVARDMFPGGTLVEYNIDTSIMTEQTADLMKNGEKVIYEAAFIFEDLIAICDVLVRTKKGYKVYEVKSSTSMKDPYYIDTAFQYYVLARAGIKVEGIYLVHINNQYVRNGDLNLSDLFVINDVTGEAIASTRLIEEKLQCLRSVLKSKSEPDMDIGLYCTAPYECFFINHCWEHIPENSVFELSGLQSKKKFELYSKGLISFENLIENKYPLSDKHYKQVNAALKNEEYINPTAISRFLDTLTYPLYFLDFETYMQAIPQADGIRPYEQIPFQYSVHYILKEGGEVFHIDFLGKEGTNTKRELALNLIKDIPSDVCVIAYNATFEKTRIKELAESFPDLSDHLMRIRDNIKDLMVPFKDMHYYTKDMCGSHSLKYVLPALFQDDPDLDYNALDIKDGTMAMGAFAYLHLQEPEVIAKIRESLLEYCELDTYAMVKIIERLKSLAG